MLLAAWERAVSLNSVINLDGQGYPSPPDHPASGKSKATVAAAGKVSDLNKHPELDALG